MLFQVQGNLLLLLVDLVGGEVNALYLCGFAFTVEEFLIACTDVVFLQGILLEASGLEVLHYIFELCLFEVGPIDKILCI